MTAEASSLWRAGTCCPISSRDTLIGGHGNEWTNDGRNHHVDSLQTWVAQVGGVGQFGRAGIVEPGEAFWTIADTAYNWSFDHESLVDHSTLKAQSAAIPESMLILQMGNGLLVEQCAIVLGGGEEAFNRNEDAQFASSFRGRNNLDLYSQTADSVSVMVNRTSDVAQVIPIWIKAGVGTLLTLEVGCCRKPVSRPRGNRDRLDGASSRASAMNFLRPTGPPPVQSDRGRDLDGGVHRCRMRECSGRYHRGGRTGSHDRLRVGRRGRRSGGHLLRRRHVRHVFRAGRGHLHLDGHHRWLRRHREDGGSQRGRIGHDSLRCGGDARPHRML